MKDMIQIAPWAYYTLLAVLGASAIMNLISSFALSRARKLLAEREK